MFEKVRAEFVLPETEVAEQAYRFAEQIEPAFVFAHSVRSYLYARELAGRGPFRDYDDELLFLSCVLHDIGLTDQGNREQRFEVDGADLASEFLRDLTGGRYDDLTGLFGVPNIPGVGISFGVDRIYDVMEELKLFPETIDIGTKVLFFNLGAEESKTAYRLLQQLRQKGIASEIYHEPTKFDKQFKYAEKKNIPFAIIIGSKEIETKTCVIKDLRKGEQRSIPFEALCEFSFV